MQHPRALLAGSTRPLGGPLAGKESRKAPTKKRNYDAHEKDTRAGAEIKHLIAVGISVADAFDEEQDDLSW